MTNVVVFPKAKRDGTPPQTIEEVLDNVERAKKEHIELVVDGALSELFDILYNEGFDLSGEDMTKDVALIIESVRAGVLKSVGYSHPLNDVSAGIIIVSDVDSENTATE